MDWKSIGLKQGKEMNFFKHFIILKSNHLTAYWVCVGDVRDILEQSHRLFFLYSKHHNQLPRNDDPNIACEDAEILLVSNENCDLLTSLPMSLYSRMEDIQCADEYGLYSLLLSIYEHFPNYKLASIYLDNVLEYLLSIHDNDISLPKLYEHLKNLWDGSLYDIQPYCKINNFIATKVAALKMQGFNH